MNTLQLKQELIHRISSIEDFEFLNAIKIILDHDKKHSLIELSDDQVNELLTASVNGKNGKVVSQLEMDRKVEKWLSE